MSCPNVTTKVLAGHDAQKAVEALNPERDQKAIRFGNVDDVPVVLAHCGDLWIAVEFYGPDQDAERHARNYLNFVKNGGRPRDWKE